MKDKTQAEIEMNVIGHITTNLEDIRIVRSKNIHQNYFLYTENGSKESLTKVLFQYAMQYFIQSGRLLSINALREMAKQDRLSLEPGGKGERLISILSQSQALPLDFDGFPMLLENLRDKMMGHIMIQVGECAKQSIKNEGPGKAFDEIYNLLTKMRVEYADDVAPTTTFEISKGYQQIYDDYIKCKNNPDLGKGLEVGWKALDNATNGFKRQTLNLIIGEVNKGKSTMLLNMARGMHEKGYNVIFFSFEMPMFQVKARYIASRLRLPYNDIVAGTLDEKQEKRLKNWFDDSEGQAMFKQFEKEAGAYFSIIDQPDDTSPAFIEQTVRQHRQYNGAPDAIFVDYLNNMRCDISSGNWWEHTGEAAKSLRKIARIYELVAFTAQQINREGLKIGRKKMEDDPMNFQVYPEHIEGWKEVINTCDSAIAFNPAPEKFELYVTRVKGRDWSVGNFKLSYIPTMSLITDEDAIYPDFFENSSTSDSEGFFDRFAALPGQREAVQDDLDALDIDAFDV